ncbi:phage holin family protein [Carnobacterium inhibens]|uniref:Membrane protein n=1 Tax=Carnobacterium inhibens subsp. gilichinskyi TaxID=1266845 RepID=U5S743_9LACT|nr:phage holin family protein [Carnobacterium inhibens]AGY81025.1 membrane protein [Carnobacterium inhibens subsp. gilichinskyi]
MRFWQKIIVNALVFLALAGFLQNMFYVESIWVALGASLVLSVLNLAVKPILFILSFPITLLTMGLFTIVINASMLSLTSAIIGSGFEFSSFGTAMLIAMLISLVNLLLNTQIIKAK